MFSTYFWIFAPLLLSVAVALSAERMWPWRPGVRADSLGWLQVALLHVGGVILVSLAVPISQIAASAWAREVGFGLFNWIEAPLWLAIVATIAAIDLVDYIRHWAHHRYRLLWRAHRLHHSSTRMEVSVGFRFHPFEAWLGAVGHGCAMALLGGPVETVPFYIAISLFQNIWEHANVYTPPSVLRLARLALITPDLHRVHHSAIPAQGMTNYGAIFSIWDRAFGTLLPLEQAVPNEDALAFGLGDGNTLQFETTGDLFVDPFRR